MADAPYLLALALVERNGERLLPLNGKSRRPVEAPDPANTDPGAPPTDPGEEGRGLALELLLRLWQRSDEGPIQRAAGDDSLLLLEMPLELISERLPLLKATWIGGAETAILQAELRQLALRGWRISIAKYEPVTFSAWS
jgi:hypothetical protein